MQHSLSFLDSSFRWNERPGRSICLRKHGCAILELFASQLQAWRIREFALRDHEGKAKSHSRYPGAL
jgi:hypothetical protein